jgi:hypothetical protein|nr:MAG TPA: hypothetical protein [Caudoviricetes sp.]
MALRAKETLDAFVNAIITNKEIMDILKLPTILETDSEATKRKKKKMAIDKVIVKSSQEPADLAKEMPPVKIDGVEYKGFGKIRMAICFAQSIKMSSELFGNPQIDIDIFYDNTTEMDNTFVLIDLISNLFSGQKLKIDVGEEKQIIRDIKNEVITSQVSIINNYERIGMRFSFYATLYKN